MTSRFLFLLTPPYTGSTVLWRLLKTSPNVSSLPSEGMKRPAVRDVMSIGRWDPRHDYPWNDIRKAWEREWDRSKPILLEKSPPHLLRVPSIVEAFPGVRFIATMRDPYAFCEGHARRLDLGYEQAARSWVLCATYQRRNIDAAGDVLFFTYEEMVSDPGEIAARILAFLPELESLSPDRKFLADSIYGLESLPIQDMNPVKLARLTPADYAAANRILARHRPLLDAFGYELRTGAPAAGDDR